MKKPLYLDINLYLIFGVTLGSIVSVSLIVPALPVIAEHFSLAPSMLGLIISMYTLPGVLFILFIGMFADRIGRKRILVVSLLVFGVAGGVIYWVDDYTTLLALRFIQGIGGATLPAMSVILIGDFFEKETRLKVMGLNSAVLSVGTAGFPFLGGILAGWGWNAPFLAYWFALPLALLVVLLLEDNHVKSGDGKIEYLKSASKYVLEARSIFVFSIGFAIFILLYGGVLTYITLYMRERFMLTPFAIGSYIAASSVASGIIAPMSQRIEKLIGGQTMLVAGFALYGLAFYLVPLVPTQGWLVGVLMLIGAAMGLTIPLVQTIVTSLAPFKYRGIMVSFNSMTLRAGQTAGPPLMALFIQNGGVGSVFAACMWIAAIFSVMSLMFGTMLADVRKTGMVADGF